MGGVYGVDVTPDVFVKLLTAQNQDGWFRARDISSVHDEIVAVDGTKNAILYTTNGQRFHMAGTAAMVMAHINKQVIEAVPKGADRSMN